MDLEYSSGHIVFQKEAESFLATEWVTPMRRGPTGRAAFVRRFRQVASERGYLYRAFPRAYGGSEQAPDALCAQVIRECFERVRAPMEAPGNGVSMFAPTLMEAAADWQKARFIPRTLTGDYRWAQRYSEPGADCDLASLCSRASNVTSSPNAGSVCRASRSSRGA